MVVSLLTGKEAPRRAKDEPAKPAPTEIEIAMAEVHSMAAELKSCMEQMGEQHRQAMAEMAQRAESERHALTAMLEAERADRAVREAQHHERMQAEMMAHEATKRSLAETEARLDAAVQALEFERARPMPQMPEPEPSAPFIPTDFEIENVQRGSDGKIVGAYIRRVPKKEA